MLVLAGDAEEMFVLTENLSLWLAAVQEKSRMV